MIGSCAFHTEHLDVEEWHRAADETTLARDISRMLTPRVTQSLPPGWQGAYHLDRARGWISERDAEATTLLVSERATDSAVGLLLLHEDGIPGTTRVEVRLGYLLAEAAWGRGLGRELVTGFVRWCRSQPAVGAVVAGVAAENAASIRILEGNGFQRVDRPRAPGDESEYRLDLSDGP